MLVFGLFVAGCIGAPTRHLVDRAVTDRTGGGLPIGTFVINVSGSLLLGFLAGLVLYHGFPLASRTVLGTGFCGAYTTFSTFAYETMRLAEEGETGAAGRVVVASLVVPALAAALGLALATL